MPDTTQKLAAGTSFPTVSIPRVGGGDLTPGRQPGWSMVVVYRGKHCPLCKRYLGTLDGLLDDFSERDVEVMAVSADPKDRATGQAEQEGWRFPVGYDLSVAQMQELGLYVSSPRSREETDRPFAEPGLFVINPQGQLQIVDVSNAPFSRPELSGVLDGIKLIQDKQYPIRGTLA
jgi:peroxiredoxin